MGVMKCAVEAFKTCSNQGLTPTYLQKLGSITEKKRNHLALDVLQVLSS